MKRLFPLLLIGCAGCAPTVAKTTPEASVPPTEESAGAQCNANPVQSFVGRPGDAATVAEIKAGSGASNVRRYATGSMLTQDFRVDRVNVEVDASGKIVKIGCG